jgi:hypothetical protein
VKRLVVPFVCALVLAATAPAPAVDPAKPAIDPKAAAKALDMFRSVMGDHEAVTIGRFTASGHDDIAFVEGGKRIAHIWLGDGKGGFLRDPHGALAVGKGACAISSAHFTASGYGDVAVANCDDNTVSVFLGEGNGAFHAAPGSPFAAGSYPAEITVGRLTDAAHEDIVVSAGADDALTLLLGDGTGAFHASTLHVGDLPGAAGIGRFTTGDHPDLVVPADRALKVYRGDGTGRFTLDPSVVLPFRSEGGPFAATQIGPAG